MKKIFAVVLSVLLLLACAACGTEKTPDADNSAADASSQQTGSVDLQTVLQKIIAECGITNSMTVNEDALFDTYGISPSSYVQAACCAVPVGAFPDEILLFEAVDAASLASVSEKLEARLAEVKNQSKNYDAENYALAQQCAVRTSGNYVALFISASFAQMNSVFDQFVG